MERKAEFLTHTEVHVVITASQNAARVCPCWAWSVRGSLQSLLLDLNIPCLSRRSVPRLWRFVGYFHFPRMSPVPRLTAPRHPSTPASWLSELFEPPGRSRSVHSAVPQALALQARPRRLCPPHPPGASMPAARLLISPSLPSAPTPPLAWPFAHVLCPRIHQPLNMGRHFCYGDSEGSRPDDACPSLQRVPALFPRHPMGTALCLGNSCPV